MLGVHELEFWLAGFCVGLVNAVGTGRGSMFCGPVVHQSSTTSDSTLKVKYSQSLRGLVTS